jgi:VCBS repeat-containing protein
MADANTPQQSFDAQQIDNQAMEQPSAGDAATPPARADVTVNTSNVGSQDGPSLLNKTTDSKNNEGNQGGPNSGNNASGGDAGNNAGGNNAGGDGQSGRGGNGAGGNAANGFAGNLGVTAEAGGTDGGAGGGGDGGAGGGARSSGGAGGAGGFAGGVGQGAPGAGGGTGGGTGSGIGSGTGGGTGGAAAAPTAAATATADAGVATTTAPAPTAPNAINNITVPTVSDNGTVTALPTDVNRTNQSSSDLIVQVPETDTAITVEGTLISTSEFAPVDAFATSLGRISISSSGAWTYIFNDGFNSLPKGESLSDSFLLTAVDGTTTALTVTIVGTNDSPVIYIQDGINNAGNVQEDIKLTTVGQLTSSDVDSVTALWSIDGTTSSDYGSISVDQTGKWTYTLNNNEKVQALATDSSFDETYIIKVTDDKGAVDTKEVTVIITGNNDKPAISVIDGQVVGSVQEDIKLTTGGQFTSNDIDLSAEAHWNIVGTDSSDCYCIDDIVSVSSSYGLLSIDPTTGIWTYQLDASNLKVQALAVGESINDFFTITVTDEKGGTGLKEVTIVIQGTHGLPEMTGNVQEEVKLTTIGQLSYGDIDSTAVWSIDGPTSSDYGSISVDSTGKWTYTLKNSEQVQALAADSSFDETYFIKVVVGKEVVHRQELTLIITGNNDKPVISAIVGQDAGRVQEDKPNIDGVYVVTGQFISSDVDVDATAVWSIDGNASSDYGSIAIDKTGKWTYTLDNTSSKVQALSAGESINDFFTIAVTDENMAVDTKDVTIIIFGTDDKVTGSAGIDVIYAGAGNETIIGGGNADILTGGTGADIFQYISTADLTTTPESIEKITDFNSVDGDKVDLTSLLSSATSLMNTMKIDSTDGSSTHNLVSISIGGSSYLMDVNNANPGAGVFSSHYAEIDSQALLGNPTLGTQASWTDVIDVKSATGFLGDTASHSITGDGWTLQVLDADITHKETVVPGGTSSVEFFRGADKVTDVNVQITTSDGVIHDVSHADKITWHG